MSRVKNYTRTNNGKVVNVRSYNTQRDAALETGPVVREKGPLELERPPIAALPGNFPGGRSFPGLFIEHEVYTTEAPVAPQQRIENPIKPKATPTKKVQLPNKKKTEPSAKSKPTREGSVLWKKGIGHVKNKEGKWVPGSKHDLIAAGSSKVKLSAAATALLDLVG